MDASREFVESNFPVGSAPDPEENINSVYKLLNMLTNTIEGSIHKKLAEIQLAMFPAKKVIDTKINENETEIISNLSQVLYPIEQTINNNMAAVGEIITPLNNAWIAKNTGISQPINLSLPKIGDEDFDNMVESSARRNLFCEQGITYAKGTPCERVYVADSKGRFVNRENGKYHLHLQGDVVSIKTCDGSFAQSENIDDGEWPNVLVAKCLKNVTPTPELPAPEFPIEVPPTLDTRVPPPKFDAPVGFIMPPPMPCDFPDPKTGECRIGEPKVPPPPPDDGEYICRVDGKSYKKEATFLRERFDNIESVAIKNGWSVIGQKPQVYIFAHSMNGPLDKCLQFEEISPSEFYIKKAKIGDEYGSVRLSTFCGGNSYEVCMLEIVGVFAPFPTPPPPKEPESCDIPKKPCAEVWSVFCRNSTKKTYIVKAGEKPKGVNDEFKTHWTGLYENFKSVDCEIYFPPTDPTPDPEPPKPFNYDVWKSGDYCEKIKTEIQQTLPNNFDQFYLGVIANMDKEYQKEWDESTWMEAPLTFVKYGVKTVFIFWALLFSWVYKIFCVISCKENSAYIYSKFLNALPRIAQFLSPGAFEQQLNLATATENLICPSKIPTSSEAIGLYLAGEIDYGECECLTKANGDIPTWLLAKVKANRTKLAPLEIVTGFVRKFYDKPEADRRLRELGFTDPAEVETLFQLVDFIPPISDVLRFMVRDTANKEVVEKFKLDDKFGENWQGELAEYGKKQGISDEVAKHYWRAHWNIPSPTQLFEFYHRLTRDGLPANVAVNIDDIKAALVQQDVPPFWVDKFLAVSFRPLTRIDTKRAYEIGALDETGMKNSYLDQGYDERNADNLVKFSRKALLLKFSRGPQANGYIKGEYGKNQLTVLLRHEGVKDDMLPEIYKIVGDKRKIHKLKVCVKNIKRRFILGELKIEDAQFQLGRFGVEAGDVDDFLDIWLCERKTGTKNVSASVLCKWFSRAFIDAVEFAGRLENVGFKREDANFIVQDCISKLDEERKMREQKLLDQREREERRRRREEDSATRRKLSDAEKQARKIARLIDRLRNSENVYYKNLETVSKITGKELSETISQFDSLVNRAANGFPGGRTDVQQAFARAANGGKYKTESEFVGVFSIELENQLKLIDDSAI